MRREIFEGMFIGELPYLDTLAMHRLLEGDRRLHRQKEVPTMRGFYLFCKSKGEESYLWASPEVCACAQYSHTLGYAGSQWNKITSHDPHMLFWSRANDMAYAAHPHTFSALADKIARRFPEVLK